MFFATYDQEIKIYLNKKHPSELLLAHDSWPRCYFESGTHAPIIPERLSYQNAYHTRTPSASPRLRPKRLLRIRDARPYHTRTLIIPERLCLPPRLRPKRLLRIKNIRPYHTRTLITPERLSLPPRLRPKRLLRISDTRPYHTRTLIKPERLSLPHGSRSKRLLRIRDTQ